MSQIFTGEGLGLRGSSLDALGGYGPRGDAVLGQAQQLVYINAANGNLLLRQKDGFLVDHNLSQSLWHSYNAQAGASGSWMLNVTTALSGLSGTMNSVGSTIQRRDEAGHTSTYRYDLQTGAYLADDGSSNRLFFDGSYWHYQRGASKVECLYDEEGYLQKKVNQDGLTVYYRYQNGQLVDILDSSQQSIHLAWQDGRLVDIRASSQGKTVYHLRYSYDALGRLYEVNQDQDTDKQYTIHYEYAGSSDYISDVRQSDGTHLHIDYDEQGRVKRTQDGEGRSTSYTYLAGKTMVRDANDALWVYYYDAQNQLTGVDSPDGLPIRYYYDAHHLTRITQGDYIWRLEYNAQGDCTKIIDEKGQTTEREYDAQHRVLRETCYQDFDANHQAIHSVTTHYIYDSKGHLRFQVAANGVVVEYRYDSEGNQISKSCYLVGRFDMEGCDKAHSPALSVLESWAEKQHKQDIDRSEYEYDARGQLRQERRVRWSVAADGQMTEQWLSSNYIYDAAGRLIEKSSPCGEGRSCTTYFYDHLGRLIRTIDNQNHVQTIDYDDANRCRITSDANGLKTIELYDRSGLRLSCHRLDIEQDYGTTQYRYDRAGRLQQKRDPQGGLQSWFYDSNGRKIAEVSPSGHVTEYHYDAYNNLLQTRSCSQRLTKLSWQDTLPDYASIKPEAAAEDRLAYRRYNRYHQLQYVIDASGAVVEYQYDARGNLLCQKAYAQRLSGEASLWNLAELPPASSIGDRYSRYFYDAENRLQATVDAEGYATEYRYDHRGLRMATRRYAQKINTGTDWPQIKPAENLQDIVSFSLYDTAGLKVADIDGAGYLTEYRYDARGNVREKIAYARVLSGVWDEHSTLTDIRPELQSNDHWYRSLYNDLNQLQETRSWNGLYTQYHYDSAGQLIQQTAIDSRDAACREQQKRYNSLGQLIASLDERGAELLRQAQGAAAIEAIWQQHATHYRYDLNGNLICKSNALQQKLFYYYDEENRLTFSVDSEGAVRQYQYNVFNQVAVETHYAGLVKAGRDYTLEELQTLLAGLSDVEQDAVLQYHYNALGQVIETRHGSQSRASVFNAFGELSEVRVRQDAWHDTTTRYLYDKRGLQRSRIEDVEGWHLDWRKDYDAFGRLQVDYDAQYQEHNRYAYDKQGNVTKIINSLQGIKGFKYDAFSRQIAEKSFGSAADSVRYDYDDASLCLTTTHLGGAVVTTRFSAFGDRLCIVDANGNRTEFSYDAKGQLIQVQQPDQSTVTHDYDALGQLLWTLDAAGHKTSYCFDANGHMLRKTVDPEGLCLSTTYVYDGLGRQLQVTDPRGIVTSYDYNAEGLLSRMVLDPDGLRQVWEYTYDAAGHKILEHLQQPQGDDRLTQYHYDALGRLSDTIIDPHGLALKTSYAYDAQGNLRMVTDARGNSSHYRFDVNNRCRFRIDATGAVTEHRYSQSGNCIETIHYRNRLTAIADDLSSLSKAIEPDDTQDQHCFYEYNAQNKVILSFDAMGYATRYSYDNNGNVTCRVQYADAYTLAELRQPLKPLPSDTRNARIIHYTWDALNRLHYTVDGLGHVSENHYDRAGNIVCKRVYANPLMPGNIDRISEESVSRSLQADRLRDQFVHYHYDAANRLQYEVNAEGFVTEQRYDAAGQCIARIRYGLPIAADAQNITAVLQTAPQDRTIRYVFDAAGHMRFCINAEGAVLERQFDAAGNVLSEIAHARPVQLSAYTLAAVEQALGQTDADDRVTSYQYDNANRLEHKTNAAGQQEHYLYDANGNVTAKTNTGQHQWTYTYDAQNRMLSETSPRVAVSRWEKERWVSEQRCITTRFDYDSFGNRVKIIKDDGGSHQTEEFVFDRLNRQSKSIVRDVAVDASGKQSASGRCERRQTVFSEYRYDAFGQRIAERDRAGNWRFQVFDRIGNLRYSVDAHRQVSAYEYDGFGNVTQQTRYSTAVTLPPAEESLTVENLVLSGSPSDRVTRFAYNRLNQLAEKSSAEVRYYDATSGEANMGRACTRYRYNAFGDIMLQQQQRSENVWLNTRFYYDRNGVQTAMLNAEHYLAEYQYNLFGELIAQKEYAHRVLSADESHYVAAASSPADRHVCFSYDALGQMRSKTLKNLQWQEVQHDRLQQQQGDVSTYYTYDALGNLTSTTDALGQSSYRYYDALGNLIGKAGPASSGRHAAISYAYDAQAHQVLETQWANGAASADVQAMRLNQASANDRRLQSFYDSSGRLIEQREASGSAVYYSYDANGNCTRSWRWVTDVGGVAHLQDKRYQYDAEGRQTHCRTLERDGKWIEERVCYNAFGEVIEKNTNGQYRVTWEYDVLGRVWRTNSAGFYQIFVYDQCDNLTALLQSTNDFYEGTQERGIDLSGAEFATALRFTEPPYDRMLQRISNHYDRLGHLILQVRERVDAVDSSKAQGLREARQSQVLDRWGNILEHSDALGHTIQYRYNSLDQMIEKILPEVQAMDDKGKRYLTSPRSQYSYDALGRCIAMTDAAGNTVMKRYDAYDQIIEEQDALGHRRHRAYDLFGNMVQSYEGAHQHETFYAYDRNNQLTRITNAKKEQQVFVNDELGRRLSQENVSSNKNLVDKLSMDYDNRGNLLRKKDARGFVTAYRYDAAGHLLAMTDANQRTQSWQYDQQGRKCIYKDLQGVETKYTYNTNGLLLSETSTRGKNQRYHYNADGSLRNFDDRALGISQHFSYDDAGNLLRKESSQERGNKIGWLLETDVYAYDALGRLRSVERRQPDNTLAAGKSSPLFSIHYDYDALNNIRHMHTEVDYYQRGAIGKNYYFTYDANNRMLINKGVLQGNNIIINSHQGSAMHYHPDGSIADASTYQNGHLHTWLYSYDKLGRTQEVAKYLDGHSEKPLRLQYLEYDLMGHVISETLFDANGQKSQVNASVYQQGQLQRQDHYALLFGGLTRSSYVDYSRYDNVGNLMSYTLRVLPRGEKLGFNTVHTLRYQSYASYQQSEDIATTTYSNGQQTTGQSTKSYDVNGALEKVVDQNGQHNIAYLNDAREGIKAKREGNTVTSYLQVGGHMVADIRLDEASNRQELDVYAGFTPQGSAQSSFRFKPLDHKKTGLQKDIWSMGSRLAGTHTQDFLSEQPYRRALKQDATSQATALPADNFGAYTVQNGDSLRAIALSVYGDAGLWYLIADANGLRDADTKAGQASGEAEDPGQISQLQTGMRLTIPAAASDQHFNHSTHKVYHPEKLLGDTSATTPVPPPPPPVQQHHAWWKTILVGVIAVVATIATAGVIGIAMGVSSSLFAASAQLLSGTAGLSASLGGGFAAGFVGSLASQGVAMACGMQDDISMPSALLRGLATAASAGVLNGLQGSAVEKMGAPYFNVRSAAQAMSNDTLSQLANMGMNRQQHFNWGEWMSAGAAGGVLASETLRYGYQCINSLDPSSGIVANELQALAGSGLHSLATGQHFDALDVLEQSFGSSLLSAYANNLQASASEPWEGESPQVTAVPQQREQDEEGLRLNSRDRTRLAGEISRVDQHPLVMLDDGSDPNIKHVLIVFDGTNNDREQMEDRTNPALLYDLFDDKKGASLYIKGVGTDPETYALGGGLGMGASARVHDMYSSVVDKINQITNDNPAAKVIVSVTAFSRGAAEARHFVNMLVERGIPDTSSEINGAYTRSLAMPRIGSMVLYDTVASLGLPGSDLPLGFKMAIPPQVENVLHITALDEWRKFFPLHSLLIPGQAPDPRIIEVALPGAHSDIGGGYPNAYSRIALNMGYRYLQRLGIPLKSLDSLAIQIPALDDPSLHLHDSRYWSDSLRQGWQQLLQVPDKRTVYTKYQ